MNLYILKTSSGGVYYVVAETMAEAIAVLNRTYEVILSCEVIATSAISGDIANYGFPKLVIK